MATDAAPAVQPDDIDRKLMRAVQARFRAIGAARLERVRGMLAERHRQFIDLLPLLLHGNHPALPGYVSQHTPCGIPGYRPDAAVLALARRLTRTFNSRGGAVTPPRVEAVYVMGSPGTLGHSDASDLDVWICYPEELGVEELTLLQRKTDLLATWARELGLEAHLFLMNGAKFRRGQREPLTGENCGSAQHYLLLDEFYRTGILLAGRHPLWWLVPPADEERSQAYTDELLRRRLVRAGETVDFGGIHAVPAGEFLGAGVWQLYKAIDSPYKSVLKLLLFEVYAAAFPHAECLSGDYKRAVYRGVTDIDELDPYLMIYRRLEAHLQHTAQPERLELVRRCLYYKAGKKLSRSPQHGAPSWQRLLMQRITAEWGWDRDKLTMLDGRSDWHIHEVGAERNALVRELTYSYRYLAEFARLADAGASIDAHEFSVLGRKLYAAHERRAGKIELLNPGGSSSVTEGELSICALSGEEAASARLWGAFPGLVGAGGRPEGRPLRQAGCLAELLAWCLLNGVIGQHTRFALREQQDGLRYAELDGMLRDLREVLPPAERGAAIEDAAFAAPATPQALLVFVNVATDPLAQQREQGLQRVSSRTDSFGYSALRENLVRNIEVVLCNSWGETVATRHAGESGIIRCLREYIQLLGAQPGGTRLPVHIRCHSASRAGAIAARVGELFVDLDQCFGGSPAGAARYVLQIGERLHLLQRHRGGIETASAGSPEELLRLLAEPPAPWCALTIDRHALADTPLPAIAPRLVTGEVTVFCERRRDGTRVLVADEGGAMFQDVVPGLREPSALAALAQFLGSVRYRRNSTVGAPALGAAARFHRLERDAGGGYSVQPLPEPGAAGGAMLAVQAIAERDEHDRTSFAVYCDGVAFSERELGASFGAELAAHIRARRPSGADYPVYITDLDLSALEAAGPGALRTVHYLRERQRLERMINAALRA